MTVLDDVDSYCWERAYLSHILNDDKPINDMTEAYLALTSDDVARAAKKIFRTERMTLALKDEKSFNKKKIMEIMQELDG